MGEANFYYFTCLKVRTPKVIMARFIILLLAAIFAHQIEAHEDAPLAVCQAYYAVNGIAAEGVREDMICCCNVRPNYFVCGISNGVISGKLQSCPEGKVFNKATPELEACVPASSQQNVTCENWIDIAEEKAAAAADMRLGITTEGTHGCIDCDIGACAKSPPGSLPAAWLPSSTRKTTTGTNTWFAKANALLAILARKDSFGIARRGSAPIRVSAPSPFPSSATPFVALGPPHLPSLSSMTCTKRWQPPRLSTP